MGKESSAQYKLGFGESAGWASQKAKAQALGPKNKLYASLWKVVPNLWHTEGFCQLGNFGWAL